MLFHEKIILGYSVIFSKIETNGDDTGSLRQVVDGYFDALVFQELSDN